MRGDVRNMNLRFFRCPHRRLGPPLTIGKYRVDRYSSKVTVQRDGKVRMSCLDCGAEIETDVFTRPLAIEADDKRNTVFVDVREWL